MNFCTSYYTYIKQMFTHSCHGTTYFYLAEDEMFHFNSALPR